MDAVAIKDTRADIEREDRVCTSGTQDATASIPTHDEADVDHQGEADEGLEGYRSSPAEAKKAFLEHLAELIAEDIVTNNRNEPAAGSLSNHMGVDKASTKNRGKA